MCSFWLLIAYAPGLSITKVKISLSTRIVYSYASVKERPARRTSKIIYIRIREANIPGGDTVGDIVLSYRRCGCKISRFNATKFIERIVPHLCHLADTQHRPLSNNIHITNIMKYTRTHATYLHNIKKGLIKYILHFDRENNFQCLLTSNSWFN